jgi:DNA repair and recombination protein RAD52
MSFSTDQIKELSKPLDRTNVSTRKGGANKKLSYIEGWHAIAEANRIFGFGGWTSETLHMECVCVEGTVSYIAKVRVTIDGVSREGWGAGHGRMLSLGEKHESAVKEAETDARKRALMTFGNQFGLALYDKEQTNVVEFDESPSAHPDAAKYKRQPTPKEIMDADKFFAWTDRISKLDKKTNWPEVEIKIRENKDFDKEQRRILVQKLTEAKASALAV